MWLNMLLPKSRVGKLLTALVPIFLLSVGPVVMAQTYDLNKVDVLAGKNLTFLIGRVASIMLGMGGSLAFLIFVVSGFQMITSRGDAKVVASAKQAMVWSTVGLAVMFGASILVRAVFTAVTNGAS